MRMLLRKSRMLRRRMVARGGGGRIGVEKDEA